MPKKEQFRNEAGVYHIAPAEDKWINDVNDQPQIAFFAAIKAGVHEGGWVDWPQEEDKREYLQCNVWCINFNQDDFHPVLLSLYDALGVSPAAVKPSDLIQKSNWPELVVTMTTNKSGYVNPAVFNKPGIPADASALEPPKSGGRKFAADDPGKWDGVFGAMAQKHSPF